MAAAKGVPQRPSALPAGRRRRASAAAPRNPRETPSPSSGKRSAARLSTSRTKRSTGAFASNVRPAAGQAREPRPVRQSSAARRRPAGRGGPTGTSGRRRPAARTGRTIGHGDTSASASCVLPDAGRAGDQDAAITEHDRAGMDVVGHAQPSAGSVTVNRAPRISPGLPPEMFSAVSVPPCASTICRLIDRPRPEFWPNASPAGRSV